MMVANGESLTIVWMRCPYDADICGADATLREFAVTSEGGWTGILECSNGHVFRLTQ